MRILAQIGIVLFVCLLGEATRGRLLPFPVPRQRHRHGPALLLLACKWLKPPAITRKTPTSSCSTNMAFFFIPAGVGLLDYPGRHESESHPPAGHLPGHHAPSSFWSPVWTVQAVMKWTARKGGQTRCLKPSYTRRCSALCSPSPPLKRGSGSRKRPARRSATPW